MGVEFNENGSTVAIITVLTVGTGATYLGKLSGFKFWSTVTLKHVDSNSLPQKKSVLDNVLF